MRGILLDARIRREKVKQEMFNERLEWESSVEDRIKSLEEKIDKLAEKV